MDPEWVGIKRYTKGTQTGLNGPEMDGIKRYTKGTQTGLNGPEMELNKKVHKRFTDRSTWT